MKIAKLGMAMALTAAVAQLASAKPSQEPHAGDINPKTEPSPLGKLSADEMQVLAHVYHNDETEVEAGKLAMAKATTPAIKSYGKMLIDDHGSDARRILALVDKQGRSLPDLQPISEADRADLQLAKATMAKLRGLDGKAFDLEFLRAQVALHDKAIAKLERMTTMVDTPDLVSMLRSIKPVLEKHAQEARILLGAGVRGPHD